MARLAVHAERHVDLALEEDLLLGDATSEATIDPSDSRPRLWYEPAAAARKSAAASELTQAFSCFSTWIVCSSVLM